MTTAATPKGRIRLIEFHDAVLDAIVIGADGRVSLAFSHLPVYHERAANGFEVWSYQASLHALGVSRFRIEGSFSVSDYVSDAVGHGDGGVIADGRLVNMETVTLSSLRLQFGSGASIDIECEGARVDLEQAIEHVDDWTGVL